MKRIALLFALAGTIAGTVAAAQTSTTPAPKTAPSTAKPAVRKPGATATPSAIKLPPGVPPGRGLLKTAFTLRYQDLKIGTGAVAEPNKFYKVNYTGWLASDGRKFDSSFDHRATVMDKDGKPEKDADGKPKLGDPQPFSFPQGFGRLIPGWDQGFEGMKIGGKRRLFIPWQLAYGMRGVPARDADHPGIPSKSDLIFDIELLEITELPARPAPGTPSARPIPNRPSSAPIPPTGATPPSPAPKPVEPTSPTPAPTTATPVPTTPTPAPVPAPAPADKPVNPEQPK
jgi:peptidylprolyl isomerase